MKLSEADALACAGAAMAKIRAMQGQRLGARGRNAVSELGDATTRAVRATLLLRTLNACGWCLSHVAEICHYPDVPAVIREIRRVGLEAEYEAAKARGDVVRGGPSRNRVKKNP